MASQQKKVETSATKTRGEIEFDAIIIPMQNGEKVNGNFQADRKTDF